MEVQRSVKQEMKKYLPPLLPLFTHAQQITAIETEKVWRIYFLNPGIGLELPTGRYTTFSAGLGIGYGGGYPYLTYASGSGFIYIISPFLDTQGKWFHNLKKRSARARTIANNSGNFISLRLMTRGKSIASNVIRTSDFDFAIGPTWGIQRKYGKRFHLLFDAGPQYYFDTVGNGNFWPLMLQLNLGFDLFPLH